MHNQLIGASLVGFLLGFTVPTFIYFCLSERCCLRTKRKGTSVMSDQKDAFVAAEVRGCWRAYWRAVERARKAGLKVVDFQRRTARNKPTNSAKLTPLKR
jgi:hypothetical protein